MKVFCEMDHPRQEMEFKTNCLWWWCDLCHSTLTEEAAQRMVPVPYLAAMNYNLLSMLDVGDIYVIVGGNPEVEYPRAKEVRDGNTD